jgi:hypothetical protein
MNIKQSLSTDNTTENGSIKKRRQFIKAAGVPVILTFSSPSVFGALCASEIASGNQSHTGTGSCSLGFSPAHWANPANKDQWPTEYKYGVLAPGNSKNSTSNSYADYVRGTKFNEVFKGSVDTTTLTKHLGLGANTPTVESHLAAALLNAASSKHYPLTVPDVKNIQSGIVGVPSSKGVAPAYKEDIIKYLDQTWVNSN